MFVRLVNRPWLKCTGTVLLWTIWWLMCILTFLGTNLRSLIFKGCGNYGSSPFPGIPSPQALCTGTPFGVLVGPPYSPPRSAGVTPTVSLSCKSTILVRGGGVPLVDSHATPTTFSSIRPSDCPSSLSLLDPRTSDDCSAGDTDSSTVPVQGHTNGFFDGHTVVQHRDEQCHWTATEWTPSLREVAPDVGA